jgi:hemerythrin-like domain-containing protein
MVSLELLKNSGIKVAGRGMLLVKKHSPEILTTVGVVGVVASAVMASKATLKLEPVVEKIKNGKDEAKSLLEDEMFPEYDKDRHNKEVARVYVKGAVDLSKLYGPSITLGLSSIACIIGAHGIMRKRNVALAAAYKAVETSFSEYRKRVIAEIGEEKEEDVYIGRQQVEIVDENGKKKKVTKVDPNGISAYARFFDEYSDNWSKTPEYNLLFLKAQQNYANDLLHARGHVFLNEVYDMIGIPRSQAGQVVGWVISKDGDNFIDFGVYDFDNTGSHLFVNGHERSILLDFNVDGVIYDLI